MKHLDMKYKKEIIEKKYLNATFQHHLTDEYKKKSNIKLKSLLGNVTINAEKEEDVERDNSFATIPSLKSFSSSPMKRLNTTVNWTFFCRFKIFIVLNRQNSFIYLILYAYFTSINHVKFKSLIKTYMKIAISGGGIGGLTAALMARKMGYKTTVI